jgi:hypothetical protein
MTGYADITAALIAGNAYKVCSLKDWRNTRWARWLLHELFKSGKIG